MRRCEIRGPEPLPAVFDRVGERVTKCVAKLVPGHDADVLEAVHDALWARLGRAQPLGGSDPERHDSDSQEFRYGLGDALETVRTEIVHGIWHRLMRDGAVKTRRPLPEQEAAVLAALDEGLAPFLFFPD